MSEQKYNPINGLVASVGSGVGGAVLFNWFDKAQYLAIKNKRSFFRYENFEKPMHGTFNSISSKIISNGMYFFWIDYFRDNISKKGNLKESHVEFLAGNMSGALTATISNPISAVKYRNWDKNWPASKVMSDMYQKGGIKSFFKGTLPRIYRDTTFSCVYVMSHYYGKKTLGDTPLLFLTDNLAVIGATMVSAPFNFAMNRMYAVKPHQPYPTTISIFKRMHNSVKDKPKPFQSLMSRLHIGVGTVRISLGMTISHRMYEYFYGAIDYSEYFY